MNSINVLLLGSGGREAALARKISLSPLCTQLFIAPGNGGTDLWGHNVNLSPLDFDGIKKFVAENNVGLVVVGNEDPLVAGIYDALTPDGIRVLGPSRLGAMLEGSKDFAKQFMAEYGIPTAAYKSFDASQKVEAKAFMKSLQPPYVLKADGLAAGKGVIIAPTLEEACQELDEMLGGKFGESSSKVVIEQFLNGIECSVFVLTDGNGGWRLLPVAKDYKRIGEGDTGLNTGGMGAVSPVAFADDAFMKKVVDRIIQPTINGLIDRGITYRGFIFFGLINVDSEPMVIEYNARMGDPETEVVMLRVESDILPLFVAAADGDLGNLPLVESSLAAATVIAVSKGYPEAYEKGKVITGTAEVTESILFHAGTRRDADGRILTSGGRVIAVSSMAPTLAEALSLSYKSLEKIEFEGKTYRRDIGRDVLSL